MSVSRKISFPAIAAALVMGSLVPWFQADAEGPKTAHQQTAISVPEGSLTDLEARIAQVANYIQALQAQEIVDYVHSREQEDLAAYLVSLTPPAPVKTPYVPSYVPPAPTTYSSHPGDFLSCVRQRESGGNYSIYNAGGSGAAGAYQFLPGTWNSIAASSGRGDLVGVDPAQASPADQDAMAQALYAQQGAAPWGGGC